MSYGLMAYAVDVVALRSVGGSKNPEAFDFARAGFGVAAERIDAVIRDHFTEGDPPTAEDVLGQLIEGVGSGSSAGLGVRLHPRAPV